VPEGHTIHRLAGAFTELFAGERVHVTSPQGRFAEGAARLDGLVLSSAQAWGKQLFVEFAEPGQPHSQSSARVLRVHLGLYGAWVFAGDGSAEVVHAIGAPRRRIGESETTLAPLPRGEDADLSEPDPPRDGRGSDNPVAWRPPGPRGAVRVRIQGEHAVADLTGPTACEVLTPDEAAQVVARLGPDPIRAGTDPHDAPERFVEAVRRSRKPIGTQLMDQAVVAGVGNIYRAEVLYRARLDPFRPGSSLAPEDVRAVWDDLVVLLHDGVRTGAIVTTRPEHRLPGGTTGRHRVRQNTDETPGAVPSDEAFYVYHREGLPCRVCRTPVLVREVAGRNLYWCATCQR
jgi:endonuclease-8